MPAAPDRLAAMRARILEKQKAEAERVRIQCEADNVQWAEQEAKEKEERAKRREIALEEKAKETAAKRAAEAAAADEQKAKQARTGPLTPDKMPKTPKCKCSIDAVRLVCKKEGPNCGKAFYGCPKRRDENPCKFFLWEEVGPVQVTARGAAVQAAPAQAQGEASITKCRCGIEAARLVVKKEGPNCGKAFFKCSKVQENERCSFFLWEPPDAAKAQEQAAAASPTKEQEAAVSPTKPGSTEPPEVTKCRCGIEAASLTVKKDGPNCGKTFFKCSKKDEGERCSFFQWAPEVKLTGVELLRSAAAGAAVEKVISRG